MTVDYREVLSDLRSQQQNIDAAIDAIERLIGGQHLCLQSRNSDRREPASSRRKAARSPNSVGSLAHALLLEIGQPMRVGELAKALRRMGKFEGIKRETSDYITVHSSLSHDSRFVRVRPGEFALRAWVEGEGGTTPLLRTPEFSDS